MKANLKQPSWRNGIQPDMPSGPASRRVTLVKPKRAAHAGGPKDIEEADPCTPALREKMLDKTVADSFPNSDPPSTIPNPCPEDPSEPEV